MEQTPTLPLVLVPSRAKKIRLLAISLGFTALGVWMVVDHELWGWAIVLLFGAMAAVFLLTMRPGASSLRMEKTGFTVVTLFRSYTVPWTAVKDLGVLRINFNRFVGWQFTEGYNAGKNVRPMSRAVAGFDQMLPDTYGLTPEELAVLMRSFADRYGEPDADDLEGGFQPRFDRALPPF